MEHIGKGLLREIVNGEVKGILARAVGIVAEVDLDLAVGHILAVRQQIGRGRHGMIDVCKAGALLSGRILHAVILLQRAGRGHEQCLRQGADRHALLLGKAGLTQILRNDCRHAGHARRGHGRTGHGAVGAIRQGGPNVAAGGGDLRLQVEVAGNAPGGEVARHKAAGDVRHGADLVGNDHLAAVQAGRLVFFGGGENAARADHRDEDSGVLILIVRQVHHKVVGALVIIDNGSGRTGLHGIVCLDGERNTAAAGDEDDLAGEVEALKALVRAEDVLARRRVAKEDVVIRRAGLVRRGIERRERIGAVVLGGIVVGRADAVEHRHHARQAGVVGRGNGERIAERAGRADRVDHGILRELHLRAGIVVLRIAELVAGGDGHDGVRVLETGKQLVVIAEGMAGDGRAERQVDRVAVEQQGVLEGRHIVRIIRAAALAKDLHRQDLRIRRHADHAVFLAGRVQIAVGVLRPDIGIRGGDTGNVRTVVALRVVVMGDVQILIDIVERIGDLGRAVELIGRQAAHALRCMQTGQDLRDVLFRHQIIIGDLLAEAGRGALEAIEERALVKARMVDIQAGIDDGDPAACAGVAVGPGVIGADHRACRSRVGLVGIRLVLIFHIDALNAVHGADRLHLAVGHTRGNAVHADGELVAHGKRHAELRRNGLDLRALLLLQAVTVGQCRSVAAETAGRIAVPGQGIAAEADDHTHRFLRRGLVRCVRFHILIFRRDGNRRLLQLQLLRLVCCKHCGNAAEQQAERQEDSQ